MLTDVKSWYAHMEESTSKTLAIRPTKASTCSDVVSLCKSKLGSLQAYNGQIWNQDKLALAGVQTDIRHGQGGAIPEAILP